MLPGSTNFDKPKGKRGNTGGDFLRDSKGILWGTGCGAATLDEALDALGDIKADYEAGKAIRDEELASLRTMVEETTQTLRFLVKACVDGGIFTREEYLAKVKE